jgi:hypothetical protein
VDSENSTLKIDGENTVLYKFDEKSSNDLVFDVDINQEYLLEGFGFK